MKAKAYIENKYKKLSDEERERREGNRLLILNSIAWEKLT